jgi:hypothetical protein
MFTCNSESVAKAIAAENKTCYGFSVFGKFYVGTSDELRKIGVVEIKGERVSEV